MIEINDEETAIRYFNESKNATDENRDEIGNALIAWGEKKKAQEYEEADAHYSKLFTDENYYQAAKEQNYALAEALDPEAAAKRSLINAYLEHRAGREIPSANYELERDAYAMASFGQKNLDDGQLFDFIRGDYDWQKQKTAAINDLHVQAVGKALADTNLGVDRPFTDGMTGVFNEWSKKYPELVDGKEDAAFLAQSYKLYYDTINDLDSVRPIAGKTLSTLDAFTKGNSTPEDMNALADTLAQATPQEREKVYNYVRLGAEAGQIDRGAMEQFAINFGQSISRGFDFIPQGSLQVQEAGVNDVLQKVKSGQKVWVPADGDLTKATVAEQTPKAQVLAEAPTVGMFATPQDGYREATPQESEQFLTYANNAMQTYQVVRELRNVAKTGVDPIRPVMEKGSFMGAVEGGVYGVGGSIGFLGATAVNPFLGVAAYQANEYDRIRLENPDMDIKAAQGVALLEGTWQAALDRAQISTLSGKLPVLGRFLGGIESNGIRRTLKVGASVAEQFGQELAQDTGTILIDNIAAALREDMPDKDFAAEMAKYGEQIPETLAASVLFGLIGGGFATAADLGVTEQQMKFVGINDKKIARIKEATTPEEADALIQTALDKRTPEDIEAGKTYARTAFNEAQNPPPEAPKISMVADAEGNNEYLVTAPDGTEMLRTKSQQAAIEAVRQDAELQIVNDKSTVRDMVDYFRALDPTNEATIEAPRTVQAELDRLNEAGDAKGIANLNERIRFAGIPEGDDLTAYNILGEASVETTAEGVFKGVIRLRENSRPEDAFEEINHVFVRKSLSEGRVTLDSLRDWLGQTEAATGETYTRETETDIIENIAKVGMDYAAGRIDETKLPPSFVDYIKRLLTVLKEAMARTLKLKDAFATGKIDADFEAYLAESVGLNQQTLVDTTRDRVANEVSADTNYSIGNYSPDQKYNQIIREITSVDPNKVSRRDMYEIGKVSPEVAAKMKFDEPVQVSLFADGTMMLSDGHHRLASAKELGMGKIPAVVRSINASGKHINSLIAEQSTPDINYSIGSPAFSQWFGKSKAVDSEGKPMVVYHGTQRPDRVGSRFRKARATSGPMAFFTNDSSIASSYATGKRDTSSEMPSDYAEWFKYKGKGMRSPVAIDRAWWSLSPEERAAVNERIYTIGYSDWDAGEGPIVADSQSIMPRDSIDYELRQAKGNGLRALVEMWLTSGSLFNQEERFLEVLQAAGVKGATLDDPNAVRSGVYPVYLSIQNPLDTANIPGDVISALEQAGKRKRAKQAAGNNPDTWDKNTISGPEWLSALKEDIAKGTTHAWTRIPDWATETLSSLGYDGIKDTGGKHGGDSHQVWIPFNETQVKSATGNRGTYDSSNPDINYSIGKATDSVTPIAINFPAPNIPSDIKNLRKYIRQMIADSLQGRTIIVERTGTEVKFTAESRAESVSKARMPFQAAPMLEAEKIVLNGVPVDISEPDQNKKTYKGTRLFRRFAIPVSIGGDVYASHFTVREPNDFEQNKGVFYEFNIGKKMEPRDMGLPPASASRPSKDDSPFNLDSEINIAALINKVNGGTSNYSISSQSEIDRVNRAMSGVTRGPSERLAIYERAKSKFGNLMAWGRDELGAMQETGADAPTMRRTQILQGLGELDAILSVLPPEVRGRIGGYTKLASIAPMDVFKDGEKVSEVSGMNGALISAWMRDGLNIGQAQKKVDFPPGYTAKENLATARSDRAIADFFRDRIKKIDAELEKFLAREYRTAILDLVKKSRPKAGDNNVRKSTLGPEIQRVADLVQRATLMDEDAVAERMLQLEQSMQSSEDNSALVEEWGILNTFGDLDSRNSDTLAQAHKWFRDQLKAGRESWSIKEEARIMENRERAKATTEWLGGATAKDRFRDKTFKERMGDWANNILLDHASFEQFVNALFPADVAAHFSDRLRKADVAAQKAEIDQRERILNALRAGAKEAGITTAKAAEMLKTEVPDAVRYLDGRKVKNTKLTIEQAEKVVRGEINQSDLTQADIRNLADELAALPADTRKEYITLKQVVYPGKEVLLPMTPGKAMQLLLSWNQPDVRDKMMREGWSEDSITDLRKLTDDPVSKAMLAHAQELYGKGHSITNPVYARMFGMAMPQVKNYAPTRFLHANDVKDIGLDGSPVSTGTTPSFAKSRVSHSAKIAPEDALSVMQQHILAQTHWVNFAELAREFRSLITNPDVRASIKQHHGSGVLKTAELWADQMEQRGGNQSREAAWMNSILGAVIGGQSVASLGFNLKTLAMQLDNAVRFGLSLDMKQIVSAMQSPDQLIQDIKTVFESDALQTRLLGGATAETRFLFQKYGGKVGAGAKIAEVSMGAINWMDSATTSFSAAIVYRANLNEALAAGMPESLARETALDAASAAIYRFAQPVSFGQKSNVENSGNMLTKAFFLFMSDPRLKTAIMADAVRGLVTGRGDKGTHIRRLIAIELMAVLSHVVASAYRDAFTDDDDEEIWQLGGWVRAMALAPLQGYIFAGSMFDSVLSQLTSEGFFTPTQNPLLRISQTGIRALKNADDILAFDDPDALLKEWVDIARTMAVNPSIMAAPAVLLNAVKPIFGAVKNANTED